MFLSERRDFLWATLLNKPHLFSLFLVVIVLNVNMLPGACRVCYVAVGFFAVSLSIAWSDLRVNLLSFCL